MKHEIVKCSLAIKIRIGMVDCNKRWFHTNWHNSRLSWPKEKDFFCKACRTVSRIISVIHQYCQHSHLPHIVSLLINSIFITFIAGSHVSFYKYTQDEKWVIPVLYWVSAHHGFSRLINGISSNVFASLQNRVQ